MRAGIQEFAEKCCDRLMELPHYSPKKDQPRPKIIAHRGAWDNFNFIENSLAAFQRAKTLGAFGIELDVHFTRDNVPVINHDAELLRLHGSPKSIRELSYKDLRSELPKIPMLSEVLALKGLHFMIEIKTQLDSRQLAVLKELLSGFSPGRDFHFLVLDPSLVKVTPFFPAKSWMLVGELRLGGWVEKSIAENLGGVAGHYLGMTNSHIRRLHLAGQAVGCGFISTKNVYLREWSRGVEWVFTNQLENLVQQTRTAGGIHKFMD